MTHLTFACHHICCRMITSLICVCLNYWSRSFRLFTVITEHTNHRAVLVVVVQNVLWCVRNWFFFMSSKFSALWRCWNSLLFGSKKLTFIHPFSKLWADIANTISVGKPWPYFDFLTKLRLWGRDFPHQSRPALRPIQSPVQCLPGLSRG